MIISDPILTELLNAQSAIQRARDLLPSDDVTGRAALLGLGRDLQREFGVRLRKLRAVTWAGVAVEVVS